MQRLTIVGSFKNCLVGSKFISKFQCITLNYSSSSLPNLCLADHLVNSLGFPQQQALSISTKLWQHKKKVRDFNAVVNAISVVDFFRNRGFDDACIRKIVNDLPRILSCKVDKTLNPKLRFLQDQGFSQSEIIRLVSLNPQAFMVGVESVILPTFQILTQLFGGCKPNDCRVITIVTKSKRSFGAIRYYLLPNVDLLRSYGIPIEVIRKRVVQFPACYVRKPEVFKDVMVKVENKLGISRYSPGFLYGIQLLTRLSEETLESKCRLFKRFGWTQSELETFIVKNSCCFSLSEALITKKLDFLMKELQYKPHQLTSNVNLITCSLEKRVVPRHKVLLILKEKSLLKKNPSFESAVGLSEPRFLVKFVIPFKEVHRIYAKHMGCSLKMLTQESAISIS
ncbi:hypothetical protein vseg_010835 [Gypsophila vaccaria]